MKRNVGMILLGIVMVLVLSACASSAGATSEGVTLPNRTVSVTGTGQVYLTPDVAYINIGVHTEAETVTDAISQNNSQASAVASSLKELGVEDKDIQTSAFNVYPTQVYSPMGEITGTKYVVDNTVMVTVRNLSGLGNLLDVVVRSGANTINSISFDVLDKTQATTDARKLALDNAKAQALEIVTAAGVELGDIQTISITNSYSGTTPRYDMVKEESGSTVPISTGQILLTAEAYITYTLK